MYIMPFAPQFDLPAGGDHEPVRAAILDAASQAFACEGYAATTVSRIALKAGLPKSNVLYYFKSKDTLYRRVLQDIATPYLKACMPRLDGDEPVQALTQTVTAMIRLFEQRPCASRVMMVELKEGAPRLPAEFVEHWSAQTRQSVAGLRQWIDCGLLGPGDPEHLLLTLWAIAQSCVSLGWHLPGLPGIDYNAAAQTAQRLVLNGLGVAA